MLIAHKIALNPNNKQATYFAKAAGIARLAYNWALSEWGKQYDAWKADNSLGKPSQFSLRKQLNAIKREQFPFMLEVTKCAPQLAIIQLGQAFQHFFAGRAKYPKYRKKGVHDRFSLSNDHFKVQEKRIQIPHLGWVKMRESLRFVGKVMSATVSRQADRWFVSITVETVDNSHLPQAKSQGVVGVDLGIKDLAILSTGEKVSNPKALRRHLGQLKRLSRRLSRKQQGSANRQKAKFRLAQLHCRIKNIRQDCLHKLTTSLTRRFDTIGIENLNIKGMMKNNKLSQAISDVGFFELRRQLDYKSAMRGGLIVVASRWFASSKLCSCCGTKYDDLTLSMREWQCPVCHTHHDRDINAAINLRNYAVSSTVSACGEESSGLVGNNTVKLSSVKQEINTKDIFR